MSADVAQHAAPTRTSRDLRHDAAGRVAARGDLADGRGQAAHRRAARLPRRRLHRSRLARREPEGRRAVPARAGRAAARRRARSSRSASTRRVKGKVDSDDTLRHLVEANVGTVCIVGKSWDYHVLEALGTTLDEGVAMVARLGRVPAAARASTCSSTPSTSSTATRATRSSRCACSKARSQAGACRLVLCDTNGGALPHDVERIVGEVVAYFGERRRRRGAPPRRRRHRRRERARRRARRRDAGAGHDQRLRRAHRQLQPHDDHPEPHAEDGHRDDPGRPARPAHAGRAPHRRARQHAAQPAGAVRRALGVRAQGRAAHERDREAPRRVRARRARARRQRHPVRRVRARRAGRRS